MTKKIVEVKDTKKKATKINLEKIKDFAEDNPEIVEFVKDKVVDMLDGKETTKKKTTKKSSKKSSKTSDMSKIITIAETLLKDDK